MNDERLRNTDDIRNEMAYRDANNASMYDLCEDILHKYDLIAVKDEQCKLLLHALTEIAESPFCSYDNNGWDQHGIGFTQYDIGVTDGHRHCSAIAKQAIEEHANKKGLA